MDAAAGNQAQNRAVTLLDIAVRCGVSISTVSLALRGDGRVRAETAERIRAAAQEAGYDPGRHESARRLAMRRHGRRLISGTIALLFPPDAYTVPFLCEMLQGLVEGLAVEGFRLALGSSTQQPVGAAGGEVDGVIFYEAPAEAQALLDRIRVGARLAGRPVVSLLSEAPGASTVAPDEMQGAHLAAQHLLRLGHRHILELCVARPGGSEPAAGPRRLDGISHALREQGFDPARHLHPHAVPARWLAPLRAEEGGDEADEAGQALLDRLNRRPDISAVMAQNDPAAVRAWHVLRAAGYRVPEHISIVGFGDTDAVPDAAGSNLLTTLRVPFREIGREAARCMAARVRGEWSSDRTLMLPVRLIERASTARRRMLL